MSFIVSILGLFVIISDDDLKLDFHLVKYPPTFNDLIHSEKTLYLKYLIGTGLSLSYIYLLKNLLY